MKEIKSNEKILNNFSLNYIDKYLELRYLNKKYTFTKFFILQILAIIFTLTNLILILNDSINNSKYKLHYINILILSLQSIIFILFILFNSKRIIKSISEFKFQVYSLSSFSIFYSFIVQAQVLHNILPEDEVILQIRYLREYVIPYSLSLLCFLYIFYFELSFKVIALSTLSACLTIFIFSIGYEFYNKWYAYLYLSPVMLAFLYLVYTHEKQHKLQLITDNLVKLDLFQNMNCGFLMIYSCGQIEVNSKMKDFINASNSENTDKSQENISINVSNTYEINPYSLNLNMTNANLPLNANSLLEENIKKLKTFLFSEFLELNEDLDVKIKEVIWASTLKAVPTITGNKNIETDLNEFVKNLISNMKFNSKFKEFIFIGPKRINKLTVRTFLRYNELSNAVEFYFNDVSTIIECENIKAANKYKNLFLNKFSHEFKNPLLNIMQLINNMKVKSISQAHESAIENDSKRKSFQNTLSNRLNRIDTFNLQNTVNNITNSNSNTLPYNNGNSFNTFNPPRSSLKRFNGNEHIKSIPTYNSQYSSNDWDQREYKEEFKEHIRDFTHIQDLCNYMISLIGDFHFISNSNYITDSISKEKEKLQENLNYGKFKIEKIIKKCIRIFRTRAELNDKNINFIYEIERNVPEYINSDSRRVTQILLNIISNSFKFTNNGEIYICVKSEKDLILFEIKDTGQGFNVKNIQKSNNNIYGMGLGLKIVRIIISLIGRNFNIQSVEGKGTTVNFSLIKDMTAETTVKSNKLEIIYDELPLPLSKLMVTSKNDRSPASKDKEITTQNLPVETDNCLLDRNEESNLRVEMPAIITPNINNMNNNLKLGRSNTQGIANLKMVRHPLYMSTIHENEENNVNRNRTSSNCVSKSNDENDEYDFSKQTVIIENLSFSIPEEIVPINNGRSSTKLSTSVPIQTNNCLFPTVLIENVYNSPKVEKFKNPIENLSKHSKSKKSSINPSNKSVDNEITKNDKTPLIRILLVDDEKLIRQSQNNIISKYLKKQKNIIFEITECSDGVECLHQIYLGNKNGIKYDYLITDETMNFMRGSLLTKTIRSLIADNMMSNLKIFMVTSYESSSIVNILGDILDGIITKPLSPEWVMKIFNF